MNLAGAAGGADLGGSSKYSREALEDRCGEGFRVNSCWTRVSRCINFHKMLRNECTQMSTIDEEEKQNAI